MIRQLAVIGIFIAVATCLIYAEPSSLVVYDLRYALKVDASKSGKAVQAWDHCHTIGSLQGIVNRNQPSLYVMFVDSQILLGKNIDEYWLEKYSQEGQWLSGRSIRKIDSVEELVGHFKESIKGAVVYDPKVPSTSNVASTVAGAEDLIAIRYNIAKGSLYDRLIANGPKLDVKVWLVNPDGTSKFTGSGLIPNSKRYSTGSAKCDAYLWMKENYIDKGLCDCTHAGYYIDYYWIQKPTA